MLGLFFGGKGFKSSFENTFGNVELDATLEENHEWSAEATTNPVEFGAPITDHVIEQADRLRIKGFVTDAPLNASASIFGLFNLTPVENRTQPVFDLLHELIKRKEVMTVYTKHRIYTDMVLTNVTIPRAPNVGEALEFNAEFINIRKVSTQIVDVPLGINQKKTAKANPALGRKTEPSKNTGKKQPETVTKPSSALSRIFGQ